MRLGGGAVSDVSARSVKIRVLQHVAFEGPGSIAAWAGARGHLFEVAELHRGAAAGAPGDFDMLVVLGGPMSVHDEDVHPWLADEKRAVAGAIAAGRPVLGICLGAQLIARVLGAGVARNPVREIGWFPLRRAPEAPAEGPAAAIEDGLNAFHWHGETFDIPVGAVRLASTDACANQAFLHGDRVLGLQFHLETTPENARNLIAHCRGEMDGGPCIQTADEILAAGAPFARANRAMARVLDELARQ